MASNTKRSMDLLNKDGWLTANVEKFNSFIKQRFDLFGFADVLALKGDVVLFVQTTTSQHASERLQKILGSPKARICLGSQYRKIAIHSWAKRGDRGKRKLWSCVTIDVTLDMFPSLDAQS